MSRENKTITFESVRRLDVIIDRGKRKNLYINIKDGEVVIKVPPTLSYEEMLKFVNSREEWIVRSLEQCGRPPQRLKDYTEGERFEFAGGFLTLKFVTPKRHMPPFIDGGSLCVSVPVGGADTDMVRRDTEQFLSGYANDILRESCRRLINLTGLCPKKITVKKMKSCWGRCSSDGNISLNYYLYEHSQECIDYVIIHELCHLVHMDHSKQFWALVSKYCPDYKNIRHKLNYNE